MSVSISTDDRGTEATQLSYDGNAGELLGLWVKIILLSIVTLGFYRFWGETRLRRYFWNHTGLMGERFDYDGTGGELFVHFLMASFGLAALLILPYAALFSGAPLPIFIMLILLDYVAFIFLAFMGIYGSTRYRVSRTLWRGMRGGLDGSSFAYALRGFGYLLLAGITGGWSTPWQIVGLWRYQTNNLGIGDWKASFEGEGGKLFLPFLAIVGFSVLGIITGVIIATTFIGASGGFNSLDSSQLPPQAVLGIVLGVLAYFTLAMIGWVFFQTRQITYLAANSHFGRVGFSADIGFGPLFGLVFVNALLLVVTLGLASPFVRQRTLRFACRSLKIYRAEELLQLTQAPGRREKAGGEGLVQSFNV